jgi:propionate CoA-transferase
MKDKVISAAEAVALISDGNVVCTNDFVQSCIPEVLHAALEAASRAAE